MSDSAGFVDQFEELFGSDPGRIRTSHPTVRPIRWRCDAPTSYAPYAPCRAANEKQWCCATCST